MSPGAPSAIATDAKGYHALRVGAVNGGADNTAAWLSAVTNDGLQAALTTSLRNLGYLAESDASAGYVVSAQIVDLDRPWADKVHPLLVLAPVDVSVSVRIHYVVTPARGGPAVFDDTVGTTGTATAGDSLGEDNRMRKANEMAVKANILEFASRLHDTWR